MTPREIIAKALYEECSQQSWAVADSVDVTDALSAAGFVIVPREYPLKLADAAPPLYESSGDSADIQRLWETLIAMWEKANV